MKCRQNCCIYCICIIYRSMSWLPHPKSYHIYTNYPAPLTWSPVPAIWTHIGFNFWFHTLGKIAWNLEKIKKVYSKFLSLFHCHVILNLPHIPVMKVRTLKNGERSAVILIWILSLLLCFNIGHIETRATVPVNCRKTQLSSNGSLTHWWTVWYRNQWC